MNSGELQDLLTRIRDVHIGILGDFCLDAYFMLNSGASEVSLETGLATRPVRTQRYSLGGAGNVAANLCAMGVRQISALGVIGRDPFGREMETLLNKKGIDTTGLCVQEQEWDTHVYAKPYERNREEQRIDFGNFNQLLPATVRSLLDSLAAILSHVDLMIINQQVLRGIHTEEFRRELNDVMRCHPDRTFIVDSRHHSNDYDGAIRKINVREGLRLCRQDDSKADWLTGPDLEAICRELYARWKRPLFLSRGDRGCVVFGEDGYHEIPGLLIVSPVDPVGAGDSMLAGIAAAMAARAPLVTAAELGGFVAGVTVQKLFQTGTATPEEILAIGNDPDYRYRPDLARQTHRAVYHEGTQIEVVTEPPRRVRFTHVIFDQDGTLSTLRQGWEEIMEPMMVDSILGGEAREVDDTLYHQVVDCVRNYINKTTGVQTLVQMKGLVGLVRQFGVVPEGNILDEVGYKNLYSKQLLRMVDERIGRLKKGELDIDDFTVKKAGQFLRALRERGVLLYLASGTDRQDVQREARILGYEDLFEGRVYGSVGDIRKDAKRIVLERILKDIGQDSATCVLTFGDGPVEIRETHKRGGYAVGIASNEIRRHGLNRTKRTRLIEAGADLVVPDFSQMDRLLPLLFPD
jgi:bifunctional ADP-heptose synthase (sugar kinase/adenylyltransferase)/beta-phosphoglucomutase-like phosphatase (HAD superfamily)